MLRRKKSSASTGGNGNKKTPGRMVEELDWFEHPAGRGLVRFEGLLDEEPLNGVVGVQYSWGEQESGGLVIDVVLMLSDEAVTVCQEAELPTAS